MKVVFLNTWHGKREAELYSFVDQQSPTTDIFCFQEASPNAREIFRQLLPEFVEYTHSKPSRDNGQFHLATYVKYGSVVTNSYALLEDTPDTGLALVTEIQNGDDILTVASVHGVSFRADNKLDTPGRLVQSGTVIESLQGTSGPKIVGGDFNLEPEAESVRMFAEAGYDDLIAINGIKTTRNKLAWERFPDNPQYYADYAFTAPGVQVNSFEVPNNEISDHLPLILEFDLVDPQKIRQLSLAAGGAS